MNMHIHTKDQYSLSLTIFILHWAVFLLLCNNLIGNFSACVFLFYECILSANCNTLSGD